MFIALFDASSIRESSVKGSDAELEAPEDAGVKRPADNLDLGTPDAIVVLLRVYIDVGSLGVRHVAISEALEFGAD